MKNTHILRFTFVAAALALLSPARGETMSVPSKEAPAFTFDIPSSWKPKADKDDESVEATAPEDRAYLSAWVAKGSEKEQNAKDLEETLRDSLKSVDSKDSQETIEVNGTKVVVMIGSGVDKRAGNKVQFRIAMFKVGPGYAGLVYIDYDNDTPESVMSEIRGIISSIKVVAKK